MSPSTKKFTFFRTVTKSSSSILSAQISSQSRTHLTSLPFMLTHSYSHSASTPLEKRILENSHSCARTAIGLPCKWVERSSCDLKSTTRCHRQYVNLKVDVFGAQRWVWGLFTDKEKVRHRCGRGGARRVHLMTSVVCSGTALLQFSLFLSGRLGCFFFFPGSRRAVHVAGACATRVGEVALRVLLSSVWSTPGDIPCTWESHTQWWIYTQSVAPDHHIFIHFWSLRWDIYSITPHCSVLIPSAFISAFIRVKMY